MNPEARTRYDEAMALYAAHQYRAAIAKLEAAYALDPRREILFAQAQATRLSGDCAAALPLYDRFLATNPPPQQVEATRIAVARCEAAALAASGPPRTPVPPQVIATLPPPPPPRWYNDRAGGLLVGAGAIAAGAGAALIASARSTDEEARAVTDRYDRASMLRDRAERRWGWGLATVLVGSALIVAGAGRYVWVGLHPRGAGVGVGSGF
jgi:tetratricopeptide (TPR) repeat protein